MSRALWDLLGFPSSPFPPSRVPFYPTEEASPGAFFPAPADAALPLSDTPVSSFLSSIGDKGGLAITLRLDELSYSRNR